MKKSRSENWLIAIWNLSVEVLYYDYSKAWIPGSDMEFYLFEQIKIVNTTAKLSFNPFYEEHIICYIFQIGKTGWDS